jgi:hypothetical protein
MAPNPQRMVPGVPSKATLSNQSMKLRMGGARQPSRPIT